MGVYLSDNDGKLIKVGGLQRIPTTVENVDVLFDTTDSDNDMINGTRYSGGLNNGTYQIDLSKYKKLRVYILSESSVGTISALMVGEVDLVTVSAENNGYRGFVDYVVPYFYIEGTSQYEVCGTEVEVPADKQSITLTTHFFKYSVSYEMASRPCYKIEGVY